MISGVAVALPALGADLAAGATALSLVETLFLAASVSALLPFGRLGDGDPGGRPSARSTPDSRSARWPPASSSTCGAGARCSWSAARWCSCGAATLREGALGYAGMALGLALFVPFVLLQRRVAAPLLNVEVLIRNRVLRNALLAQWLLYTNAFGAVFLLSLHLQSVLGQSANVAGQVIAVGSLLMALVAPYAGSLADRYRASPIAAIGIAVGIVSAVMGALLDAGSGLLAVGLVLAVQGLGFAFFSSPNMALIMNSVPPERTGIASALGATARALGMVSGMLIVAALVSVNLGHDPVGADPARFVDTMQLSFWILVGTTTAALAIGLRR